MCRKDRGRRNALRIDRPQVEAQGTAGIQEGFIPADAPPGWTHFYAGRTVDDEDEVITFGFFDGTAEELRASHQQDAGDHEDRRRAADQLVKSVGANGVYEVLDDGLLALPGGGRGNTRMTYGVSARSCRTHSSPVSRRRPSTVRAQLPISSELHFGMNSGGTPTPTIRPRRRLQLPDSGRLASTVALSLALRSRRKIERGSPPGWTKLSNGQSAVASGRSSPNTSEERQHPRPRQPAVGALRLGPLLTS
jgi:hypothetical protein